MCQIPPRLTTEKEEETESFSFPAGRTRPHSSGRFKHLIPHLHPGPRGVPELFHTHPEVAGKRSSGHPGGEPCCVAAEGSECSWSHEELRHQQSIDHTHARRTDAHRLLSHGYPGPLSPFVSGGRCA